MLEELYKREIYGPELAETIETMGSISVTIANRWALGWLDRVKALLEAKTYLANLQQQTEAEVNMVAEAVEMDHLTHSEKMKVFDLQEAPPAQ